jgi:F-type H+-transporting ATPase subunit delta
MAFRIANRYARALADVIGATSDYRHAIDDLAEFGSIYGESSELRNLFEAPAVPLGPKLRVLDEVLKRLNISPGVSNFLRVLVQNYRMSYFDEINRAFRRIANERLGIVAVSVFSANELAEREREALASRFRELTGKQVEFEFHLDPELLGGVRAQVGSTVYDGSVRGALDRFKEQLTTT